MLLKNKGGMNTAGGSRRQVFAGGIPTHKNGLGITRIQKLLVVVTAARATRFIIPAPTATHTRFEGQK